MRKQLIFLDIDGTLVTGGENTPPDSALKAIRGAQANGHKVFLCSGRNKAMMSPFFVYGFDGYVGSAGGYVVCGEHVIFDHPMTTEQYERAITLLHKNNVVCTVETLDTSYGDENLEEFLSADGHTPNSEMLRWKRAIDENLNVKPFSSYAGEPVYKIVMMMNDAAQLAEAKAALEDEFEFCMQESRWDVANGEMINRAFDKGRGIECICRFLNHPLEDTIGFGDSMNDLQMMETVGFSVCMEDGSETLKEISDMITPPLTEDGIYKAFSALGLLNEAAE